jgi:hypothetical protein
VGIRRKFGKEKNSRVQVLEQNGMIDIGERPSILNIAGSRAGKRDVEQLRKMLNQLSIEDA